MKFFRRSQKRKNASITADSPSLPSGIFFRIYYINEVYALCCGRQQGAVAAAPGAKDSKSAHSDKLSADVVRVS